MVTLFFFSRSQGSAWDRTVKRLCLAFEYRGRASGQCVTGQSPVTRAGRLSTRLWLSKVLEKAISAIPTGRLLCHRTDPAHLVLVAFRLAYMAGHNAFFGPEGDAEDKGRKGRS